MNERRSPQYQNYSPWGPGQQYPSNYPYSPSVHDVDVHQSSYGGMASPQHDTPYPETYYTTSPSYQQHGTTATTIPATTTSYHSTSPVMSPMRDPQSTNRHYHSHSQSHTTHLHSPYSQTSPQSQSPYIQARERSNSQTAAYLRTQAVPIIIPQQPSSHYPPPQAISISPQYPASPTRPFTCDLCALSFNRQHDLKRHRETHTGEKPYLCNGGCGKTFTRKDALKRHQLVKQCGKVDEAWP